MPGEVQPMGFRAQIREILSKESVALVPVSERNLQRFDATLNDLSVRSVEEDGILNVDRQQVTESNKDWLDHTKALWVFGSKEANIAIPDQALGFVNVYEPEHMDKVNEMLVASHKKAYDKGAVVELASYAKGYPEHRAEEGSADKLALSKVFLDDQFKDVRAVTVWVTHEEGNVLDPRQEEDLKSLGAMKVGTLRYDEKETVDSTCFIIPRQAFLNKLTAPQKMS